MAIDAHEMRSSAKHPLGSKISAKTRNSKRLSMPWWTCEPPCAASASHRTNHLKPLRRSIQTRNLSAASKHSLARNRQSPCRLLSSALAAQRLSALLPTKRSLLMPPTGRRPRSMATSESRSAHRCSIRLRLLHLRSLHRLGGAACFAHWRTRFRARRVPLAGRVGRLPRRHGCELLRHQQLASP
jgi:hypothetical protein